MEIKVQAQEFGIEENRAAQIAEQFKPMLEKMQALESAFNEVQQKLEEHGVTHDLTLEAKRLRLDYVKVRTGTAKIHKEQKAFYLAAGRFIDGWKNAQVFASQGIEDKLKSIEDHYEIQEQKRIEALRAERWIKLSAYLSSEPEGLGQMGEETFEALLGGAKTSYEAKLKAEAEAKRLQEIEEEKRELRRNREMIVAPYKLSLPELDEAGDLAELSDDEWAKLLRLGKRREEQRARAEKRYRQRMSVIKDLGQFLKLPEDQELEDISEEEWDILVSEAKKSSEAKAQADKIDAIRLNELRPYTHYLRVQDVPERWSDLSDQEYSDLMLNLILEKEKDEAEQKRLQEVRAKYEAEQKEKAERERLRALKEKEEAEARRAAELAPDKDKLQQWLNQVKEASQQLPTVSSEDAQLTANSFSFEIGQLLDDCLRRLSNEFN